MSSKRKRTKEEFYDDCKTLKEKQRLSEKFTVQVDEFEPRTEKQIQLAESIENNEVTVCIGPAGTGKSYVTIVKALEALGQGYKRIGLVKSLTKMEGEDPGFIKGSLDDKMAPVMMSFTWTIDKILGKDASKNLLGNGTVEIFPLAFVRGVSIDDTVVIIDEAQNLSKHAFKTIITRIGENSKYIILGDIDQIDRKKASESCLSDVYDLFKDTDLIGTIQFEESDCVRNPIIPKILEKLREKEI